jgi:probable addiction module antidote protein
MAKKLSIRDLPEFDASDYLDDDEAVVAYLRAVVEDGDPGLLAAALGDVAKARGMREIADKSGITREALYKALRKDAHPRYETVARVLAALGLRLTIVEA